jgi:hypothetical protein
VGGNVEQFRLSLYLESDDVVAECPVTAQIGTPAAVRAVEPDGSLQDVPQYLLAGEMMITRGVNPTRVRS